MKSYVSLFSLFFVALFIFSCESEPVDLSDHDWKVINLSGTSAPKEKLEGLTLEFKDGQEILDFLFRKGAGRKREDQTAYLLLLDIRIPKIDGVEVLRQRRAQGRRGFPRRRLQGRARLRDLRHAGDGVCERDRSLTEIQAAPFLGDGERLPQPRLCIIRNINSKRLLL
jgi:CheY-like chemotaxis protein